MPEKSDKKDKEMASSCKTNMVTPDEPIMKALMFSSAHINGVHFPRRLIDTGSAVNLMPLRAVREFNFAYSPGGIPSIRGYDGREGQIVGGMCSQFRIGNGLEVRFAHFWISPDLSHPIIGLPTLRECKITIDCTNHKMINENNGQGIACSFVTVPVKEKEGKNGKSR